MAKVIFKRGPKSAIGEVAIKDGQIIFTTDTGEMYIDISDGNEVIRKQYLTGKQIEFIVIPIGEELPTQNIKTNAIYFKYRTTTQVGNIYDEYVYANNAWERIGSTDVDLSNYYTKSQTDTELATKLTEPSSNLVVGKYFRIASIDADGHAVLECVDPPTPNTKTGATAPTTSTVADYAGQLYYSTDYKTTFICSEINSGVYTWKQLMVNKSTYQGQSGPGTSLVLAPYNEEYSPSAANGRHAIVIGGREATAGEFSIAIGPNAKAYKGIAIGYMAKTGNQANGSSIQLCYSANPNNTPNTLQFKDYRIIEEDGTIPFARMNTVKTIIDQVAVPGAKYFLGEQSTVSFTLPDTAVAGQEIMVSWYNGSNPATLTISEGTTPMLDFTYVPTANTRSELNCLWDGSYWSVLGVEQGVPEDAE